MSAYAQNKNKGGEIMTQTEKLHRVVDIVKANKTISKHLAPSFQTELGNCRIIIFDNSNPSVEVYVDTDKRIFEKTIQKIKQENKELIKDMYFWKSDGSCSSFIKIKI